jgi:hypothetical protein
MAMNRIQFQSGLSLNEFLKDYEPKPNVDRPLQRLGGLTDLSVRIAKVLVTARFSMARRKLADPAAPVGTWVLHNLPAERQSPLLFPALCAGLSSGVTCWSHQKRLLQAMEGHVLAESILMGRYRRH